MVYPLVRELAAPDAPDQGAGRGDVPGPQARWPAHYRWLARPVTDAEYDTAYRANALFDAHRDDQEFGYRFLADEASQAGRRRIGADD